MLKKLINHENKAIARLLLPLYLVLAVLTVLDRIVINLDIFTGFTGIIPAFITFTYVMLILAVIVVSFVVVVIRFYKNLMQDEGYLMFTLPVKPSQLITSKLITSMLWSIISSGVVIISLIGAFASKQAIVDFWEVFLRELASAKEQMGGYFVIFMIEVLILTIVGMVFNILHIYVSIALGQLINGHKILGSFAAYIVTNIVIQVVSTICIFIGSLIFKNTLAEFESVPTLILPLITLFVLAFNFIFFYATNYIFKSKLNLE